mmetsp:Transcript_14463/g.24673  ORF Transcript_14463/g.24673 Transcript_14463/m.24673 type:complete len:84 (+) Transcript_14463:116-367(+)
MKFSLYLLCALLFVAAAHARSAPDVEGFEIQVFNNAFCRSELNSAPYGHYNYFWPNAAGLKYLHILSICCHSLFLHCAVQMVS